MPPLESLWEKIKATPFIDTHEHLIEEKRRLRGPQPGDSLYPCDDWAYLFWHYASNDLVSAGMVEKERKRFFSPDVDPEDKWSLLEPYWPLCRNTGYFQAVRWTLRLLFKEEELGREHCKRITEKMRALLRKGYYYSVLRDYAKVQSCQVNSLEALFCETEYPDLLHQDLSFVPLSTGLDPKLPERFGVEVSSLKDWCDLIDHIFDLYGPRAIAVKNQSAYARRLDYQRVEKEEASQVFERWWRDPSSLTSAERKPLEDFLFRYCITKATEYQLPVKLHTGYYAGNNGMPLERVHWNASDLCLLLRDFPHTPFVIMHITYPYQEEAIALAKHYTNAYVDLCWAWIINPLACVRFVKEFLTAAPASKLFSFGGDYVTVETVVGHSEVARRGLYQALRELIEERWLSLEEALEVVDLLMYANARRVFRIEERGRALSTPRG